MVRTAIPLADYPSGTRTSLDQSIPVGDDSIVISANNDAWAVGTADVINLQAELSLDGGATWRFIAGFTATGKRSAGVETAPAMSFRLPEPSIVGRLVRLRLETKTALRTRIDFDTADQGRKVQPASSPRSVAFDAVDSVGYANVSSASWTHTPVGVPTGVAICIGNLTADPDSNVVTPVTYGGTGCTEDITRDQTSGANNNRSSIWGLANPASGAQTVAVTFGSGGNFGGAGSITVTGGNTVTLFSNNASAESLTTGITVDVTSAVGELVVDCLSTAHATAPTGTVGAGQTERFSELAGGSGTRGLGSTEPGAATVTMSWTVASSSLACLTTSSFKVAAPFLRHGLTGGMQHMGGGV